MLCILKKLSHLWHYAPFSLENTFIFPKGEFKSTIRAICNESLIIQSMFWTQFCLVWLYARVVKPLRFLEILMTSSVYFFHQKSRDQKDYSLCWVQILNMFTVEPTFNMSCLVLAMELIWSRDTLNRSFF